MQILPCLTHPFSIAFSGEKTISPPRPPCSSSCPPLPTRFRIARAVAPPSPRTLVLRSGEWLAPPFRTRSATLLRPPCSPPLRPVPHALARPLATPRPPQGVGGPVSGRAVSYPLTRLTPGAGRAYTPKEESAGSGEGKAVQIGRGPATVIGRRFPPHRRGAHGRPLSPSGSRKGRLSAESGRAGNARFR